MVGVILSLALILGIAAIYGIWSGMWTGAGGGFHGSLGPVALAFATAAGFMSLMDTAAVFTRPTFPPAPSINFGPLLIVLLVYAVLYTAFTRAPFAHHRFLTAALFDRVMEGKSVFRAYSQRRASSAMAEMLGERGTAGYR